MMEEANRIHRPLNCPTCRRKIRNDVIEYLNKVKKVKDGREKVKTNVIQKMFADRLREFYHKDFNSDMIHIEVDLLRMT